MDIKERIADALYDKLGWRLDFLKYYCTAKLSKLDKTCWALSKLFVEKEIPNLSYDLSWNTSVKTPFYKCYSKPFVPTSITGSAMDGARLNVGGAQGGGQAKELGLIAQKRGALYFALEADTAKLEAHGRYVTAIDKRRKIAQIDRYLSKNPNEAIYEITSLQEFDVVDFDKAIQGLEKQCDIDKYLSPTDQMNGEWSSLNYPAPVQLLSRWLTDQSGFNGILYDSTVDQGKRNIVWFALDDLMGSKIFQHREL